MRTRPDVIAAAPPCPPGRELRVLADPDDLPEIDHHRNALLHITAVQQSLASLAEHVLLDCVDSESQKLTHALHAELAGLTFELAWVHR